MQYLTVKQTASILGINNTTLNELVNSRNIPYSKVKTESGIEIKFNPYSIDVWLGRGLGLAMDNKKYVDRLKKRLETKYPEPLKKLREFNKKFSDPYEPKGYYLVKIANKKLGFVYYVRYIKDGKLVPSRYCTHTNDEQAARSFAVENRDRILTKYYDRKIVKKLYTELYTVLKRYYAENSPYLQVDAKRGRVLGESARVTYHNFIIKQFIPYLRKERIRKIEEIDTPLLARFQNYLLADKRKKGKIIPGIKPQTVEHYISYISMIFDHLLIEGSIKANPCASLIPIKIKETQCETRGCYDVSKLKGVFNRRWENELSYLLCLIIYTTDMRNCEIERMRVKNFFMIDNIHFLHIPESKSINGVRIVPIHDFVYRKIMAYVRKNNIDDYIFKLPKCKRLGSKRYKAAYTELANYTGYEIEQLEAENITFYSGRHFWKTLMNSENLGDVEEYFMGHKVSADVAKRYNHRDKQGKKKLLEKTRKVFQILDKCIFKT